MVCVIAQFDVHGCMLIAIYILYDNRLSMIVLCVT